MNKKYIRLSLFFVLIIAIASLSASQSVKPVLAGAIKVPIDGYNIACSKQEGTVWVEDGILHIRGRILQSVVISENEYHAGTGQIIGNANIDLSTGYGSYFGTLEIYPDAYPDNYWSGNWTMQINESGNSGIARLQGFGDVFWGWSIKSDISYLSPEELAPFSYACGDQPISGSMSNGILLMSGE